MEGVVEGQKMLLPVLVLGKIVHEEGVLVAAVFVLHSSSKFGSHIYCRCGTGVFMHFCGKKFGFFEIPRRYCHTDSILLRKI